RAPSANTPVRLILSSVSSAQAPCADADCGSASAAEASPAAERRSAVRRSTGESAESVCAARSGFEPCICPSLDARASQHHSPSLQFRVAIVQLHRLNLTINIQRTIKGASAMAEQISDNPF